MRKILVIAKREYQATVRTKAFIISVVLMPIMMVGGMFIQKFLHGVVNASDKRIVVLDGTGVLTPKLVEAARVRNETEIFDKESHKQDDSRVIIEPGPRQPVTDDLRLEQSERVRRHEIFAFIEIPAG